MATVRIENEDFTEADPRTVKVFTLRLTGRPSADRGRAWLRNAMIALAVLAAAAATVSWDAQYVMVGHVEHNPVLAARHHDQVVAGAILTCDPVAIGISNLFARPGAGAQACGGDPRR